MAKVLIATAACAASTAAACATQRKQQQQGRSPMVKFVAAIQLVWGALLTGGGIGFAIICMYP